MLRRIPIAIFLLFSAVIIHSGFYTPVTFDGYYFATISKNIASGHGWVDSYDKDTWFVATTTGPLVLIPGAITIKLLGNEIWVPALASAISNLFWLAVFLYSLKNFLKDSRIFLSASIGTLFVFIYYENYWWTTFAGEMPSFLLFLIGALIAVEDFDREKNKYFLLGVVVGLSMYAKMIALPGFGGIAIYLACQKLRMVKNPAQAIMALLTMIGFGLAGMVVILLPFRVYEAINLHMANVPYKDFFAYKQAFYGNNSSLGVLHLVQSGQISEIILKNIVAGKSSINEHLAGYGISFYFAAVLFVMNLVSAFFSWRQNKSGMDRLIVVLEISLLLYVLYFLVLVEGIFIRYALHPLLLLFLLTMLSAIRWFSWRGLLVVVVLLLLPAPGWRIRSLGETIYFQPIRLDEAGSNIRFNQLMLDANDYITKHQFTYPLASCGWMSAARSVVYLQNTREPLKDCFSLIEESLVFDESDYLQRYPEVSSLIQSGAIVSAEAHYRDHQTTRHGHYQWSKPVNFTLVIDNANWRFAKHDVPTRIRQNAILASCKKNLLYETELFRIMECPFSELQKHIDLDGTTPFVGIPKFGLR